MQSISRRIRLTITFLFLVFAAAGISTAAMHENVQAATANGFVTRSGKTYYFKNGKMVRGWLSLNGKKYFFGSDGSQRQGWAILNNNKYFFAFSTNPKNRYMVTGWMADNKKVKRYFNGVGVLQVGWRTINGKTYYFDPAKKGGARIGWLTIGSFRYFFSKDGSLIKNTMVYDSKEKVYRYFNPKGQMTRNWYTFNGGKKRYFTSTPKTLATDGIMKTGFTKVGNKTYYLSTNNTASMRGLLITGWITQKSDGSKYYFDPQDGGAMAVNKTMNINGVTYVFDKNGKASIKTVVSQTTSNAKTIKNYLQNGLQPIGQCLYVWGGWGHGTTKGVPSEWKAFYDSHANGYNYHGYEFQRTKGLDCSGFVGWAAYQVMQSRSNVGSGYTVVSGAVGSTYQSLGWGTIINQAQLASSGYKIYPGDVGFDDGHTWIMLGQCRDKSCVVLHSTNHGGVQLAGTPTPDGNYSSQAVALARQYMAKYPSYNKYTSLYKPSTGNFIRRGNFLRWNRATLADPDGYLNMTADQILADLYR